MDIDDQSKNPTPDDGSDPLVESRRSDPPPVDRVHGDWDDVSRALRLLKEISSKSMEESLVVMPNFLLLLKHNNLVVVRQSITTGTSLFNAIFTEMAFQLFKSCKVEGWLEEMWSWMVRFKDAVCGIMFEPGSLGTKMVAAKFLEICFLLFTTDVNDNDIPRTEGKQRNFSISWFQGYPVLNQTLLEYEASKILDLLVYVLQSAHTFAGSLVITIINCLASVAKRRPAHYNSILCVLLGFKSNFDISAGVPAESVRYSLRTAFIGFLRCNHPMIVESRDKLSRTLRAMYPGEAIEQTIRQVEKMSRSSDRNSGDMLINKDDPLYGQISVGGELMSAGHVSEPSDMSAVSDEMPAKRTCFNTGIVTSLFCDLQDANGSVTNSSWEASQADGNGTVARQMIKAIGALLAAGERGCRSIETLVLNTQADLMADMVIETMKYLPKSPIDISRRNGSIGSNSQTSSSSIFSQSGPCVSATTSWQVSALSSEHASAAATSSLMSTAASDIPSVPNFLPCVKRDPRRDSHRPDSCRAADPLRLHPSTLNS